MPANPINTIRVQVGNQFGPTVRNIAYGTKTLKSATDLSLAGAQDGDVIAYNAANNNFYVTNSTTNLADIDAGFF
jgi:hypothetical protein